MGYQHTWDRPAVLDQVVFDRIRADFARLLPALANEGVRLGDALGVEEPVLSPDEVTFNGRAACRCRVPRLALEPHRHLDEAGMYDLTWGKRRCLGDGCYYDTFHFPRVGGDPPDSVVAQYCKTNRRPYDLAVTAFLLVAKRHLGGRLRVYSDSRERWWDEPRALCQEVLGYGAGMRVGEPWEEMGQAV